MYHVRSFDARSKAVMVNSLSPSLTYIFVHLLISQRWRLSLTQIKNENEKYLVAAVNTLRWPTQVKSMCWKHYVMFTAHSSMNRKSKPGGPMTTGATTNI